MDRQRWLLLGLLAVLVVVLFLLSVAIGSGGGEADPENSGGIEALDGVLGALPGLGGDLEPGDIDADCFDTDRFVLDRDRGVTACTVAVGNDVDRVRLRYIVTGCSIDVFGQDGAPDHRLDAGDADDAGELRIALTGSGADLRFALDLGADRCVLELA